MWFYEVPLPLWAHAIVHGEGTAEPADIVSVPATHVATVPRGGGGDTSACPCGGNPAIARARTGRRPAAPPPPPRTRGSADGGGSGAGWPQVPGDGSDRWKITYPRHPYNATASRRSVLHHASCFTAQGPADLTTDQALEVPRRPGAQACEMCGAEQLTVPPGGPGKAR
ncbi:DUF6233 domain-containing protein [Streptomyces albireticuli]|uniref:Uncharacterized protein n=1 Tax=Streptomyces albireticuli TaxID=1940 RepID=A0A2A2D1G6_9ACTN|nr:DUF6233 domain-containing protein [Streptomyces albireticuli]MCD9145733.1 DUF6233 domain-containing protein [Streptomyces albireticuli]MCD9165535.1 DUF6233 domain-containing protein [Streptomyces albireticuli]MCD9195942.1 DUF6233 domain-containing protein [Streptomyces albireticuli]PAU45180.1 hypothetical protein CK936_30955 [Streptomyces albireticuli]